MESNGFRRISAHCITVSSDQYQKYKCFRCIQTVKQYLVLVKKEQWGDFSVVGFCERIIRLSSKVIFND